MKTRVAAMPHAPRYATLASNANLCISVTTRWMVANAARGPESC